MLKRIIASVCLIFMILSSIACNTNTEQTTDDGVDEMTEKNKITEVDIVNEKKEIVIAKSGEKSAFSLTYDLSKNAIHSDATYLKECLEEFTGKKLSVMTSEAIQNSDVGELIICDESRAEVKYVRRLLSNGEFGIGVFQKGEGYIVALAARGEKARMCGIQYLINKCRDEANQTISITSGEVIIDSGTLENLYAFTGLDVIEDKRVVDNFIIQSAPSMRDPNVFYHDGNYYIYGTGWVCYRSTSLEGPWTQIEMIKHSDLESYGIKLAERSAAWAPELHAYNGKFYLFTSYACGAHDCDYKVKDSMKGEWQVPGGHRASIVLVADSPEGPFIPISRNADGELGHSTPADEYTIDATLYVDREGQPWMVYSKEWMTVDAADTGYIYAAKLSEDLSQFISEPQLVFAANLSPEDGSWKSDGCMDATYFYRAQDGTLYTLWSPFVASGYSVAVARSESGEIDGPWVAESELLFSKELGNGKDGGHGSLFEDEYGQLWLAVHSPNSPSPELPTFIPLIEKDNKLVWGLVKH